MSKKRTPSPATQASAEELVASLKKARKIHAKLFRLAMDAINATQDLHLWLTTIEQADLPLFDNAQIDSRPDGTS